jgi:C4-dicarboxylate transporter/malic acid transport protein
MDAAYDWLGSHRRRTILVMSARATNPLTAVAPNWFAAVMGTGIVANAAALLPVTVPGLLRAALVIWILAAAMLIVLVAAGTAQYLRYPEHALSHHRSLAMAPFYGAPPMAILTVGSGALLVGRQAIGLPAAVVMDEVLWVLGTVTGLLSAVAIPYLMFTHLRSTLSDAYGSWLMPIVPPMVSAAAGAGLVAHLPAGQDRLAMVVICYALFGISLFMSVITITLLWQRLAQHGVGPARMVPTLWIVLGPLGQSVTASGLLAHAAGGLLGGLPPQAIDAVALLYGIPVWGFAVIWVAIAGAITVRTIRDGLPFAPTWWSFTFPVGTVATGTSVLALHAHATFLTVTSEAFYGFLVVAWFAVAVNTARHGLRSSLPPLRAVQAEPAT